MSLNWKAAPAGLALLFLLPFPATGQEKEVHDTPRRYREWMKDPRMRAALKGEKLPSSPAEVPKAGPEKGRRKDKGDRAVKKEEEKDRLQVPPRLQLPPPPTPKPVYKRTGPIPRPAWTGGTGRSPAGPTPAPLGDDSLWPWNPSLLGNAGEREKKRGKHPSPGGDSSPPGKAPGEEKSSPGGSAPESPAFHGLFGEEDQPGLFLGVEETSGGPDPENPAQAADRKGREAPSPSGTTGGKEPPRGGGALFLPAPPAAAGGYAGGAEAAPTPAGEEKPSSRGKRAAAPLPPPSAGGGVKAASRGKAAPGKGMEEARKDLDRMFLALGGLDAFRALGGLHATIRITAYDRMGAEVFSRSAEQEALTGSVQGDRLSFTQGPVLGRRGEAFWASFRGVDRPDMVPRAAQELRVLSFLLRFPFCLAEGGRFQPVSASPVRRGGNELIEVFLEGTGGEVTLYLEPTTCIPREVLYAPAGGKPVRILLSDWRNLQGVVLPSRKAVLSSDGKRVSLEIRTLQVLGGFRWGPEHFLPPGKTP